MSQAELSVEGMSCNHCKATVESRTGSLAGVESVKVDLAAKKVTVTYDESKVNLVDIKQAIMDAGYTVIET